MASRSCTLEEVGLIMSKSYVDSDFWCGKKVFVTGHTGFKGSGLSLWLSHMGAVVKGFSLESPTIPSLF